MIDRLLRCLYSAGASCNNQSETSVAASDIRKFQTKLRSIEALALILAPIISIYNGQLLMITARPQQYYCAEVELAVSSLTVAVTIAIRQYSLIRLPMERWPG